MRSLLWFNLLRFCCWIAVPKIQTIQLPGDNQCLWDGKWKMVLICGYGSRSSFPLRFQPIAAHFVAVTTNITGAWSRRCNVAAWRLDHHVRTGKKPKRAFVANEMSMHWENSGPKQAAWTQNKRNTPPISLFSLKIASFKPIYKHYLYFLHTLVHAHTDLHYWPMSAKSCSFLC